MPSDFYRDDAVQKIVAALRDLRATQQESANALQALSETAVEIAGTLKALRVEAELAANRALPIWRRS